ncbi:MAG TPA: hypothetical protein VKZ18_15885 [Polyangia bacterium]|nr:hypothetical protein [Polyangia bacterium]
MKASIGIGVFALAVVVGTVARASPAAAGDGDHALFVGRWAVGYQGISSLPIAGNCCNADDTGPLLETVSAPVIGVRHWIRSTLGVDAGIGIGIHSVVREASVYGFALHAGLPIVLGQGRHTVFEVTPEATLGFTIGHDLATPPPIGGTTTSDGFLLRVGARAGAEVHFGFIGIPELALQATVGLYWLGEAYNVEVDGTWVGSHFMTLTTSVNGNPWDIFSESIAALYYF